MKNGHKLAKLRGLQNAVSSWLCNIVELHFAHLQNGPVSIEVQRWFSLRCIVPKIFTFKYRAWFRGVLYLKPAKSCSKLIVNIFGTMHRKLNHLWTSIDTGRLYKYAKCSSTILHNQEVQRFEDRVIWRVYGRFSRTITRDYAVFFSRVAIALFWPLSDNECTMFSVSGIRKLAFFDHIP